MCIRDRGYLHKLTRSELFLMITLGMATVSGSTMVAYAAILKAFINLMGIFPIGTLTALSTGELAIVCDLNPEARFAFRPRVKLITDATGNLTDGGLVDLSDRDPQSGLFPRTIVKVLDPHAYGIEVADYFLAQAQ